MARGNMQQEAPRPRLLKPRSEAKELIEQQVKKGQEIAKINISNEADLRHAEAEERKWGDYSEQLLDATFSDSKFTREFKNSRHGVIIMGKQELWAEIDDFQRDMRRQITTLESVAERINLVEEDISVTQVSVTAEIIKTPNESNSSRKNAVFVVHGHDAELKNKVTTLLLKLKVRPIVLADEANSGRTIIEKFEHYANEASFAIVLLTPDDLGKEAPRPDEVDHPLEPRARQNVVLELGYFMGKLDRSNVCALLVKDVERPSDIDGVVYVPVDPEDAWQYKLAKELKAGGYDVDLNDV